MLDTWEFRAILEKGKALNPLRLKASEMAPPVGLEPTTLSVRDIVALQGCPKRLAFWGEDEVRNE